jgi:hypothetical protein
MRSPSIVPGFDVDGYLVLDDFGSIGRAYREVDESEADKASVIRALRGGGRSSIDRLMSDEF